MKVIKPVPILPASIIDSTATDSEPLWDVEATYERGAQVIYEGKDGPSIYQSAAGGNRGLHPDRNPDDWVRRRPTNRWAPFDGVASRTSTSEDGFSVQFAPGARFEAVALFGLKGVRAKITVTIPSAETPVFEREVSLRGDRITTSWKEYFFGGFNYISDIVIRGIPPYGAGAVVCVEVFGSGQVGVGEILLGMVREIGCVEYGARHGIRDYTQIKENEFGDTLIVKGAHAKRSNLTLYIEKSKHRAATKILTEITGIPAVYIGSEDPQYEALVIFGYVKDWEISIDHPTVSSITMQINGLK